jgi:hypothetical protein
MLSSMDNYQLVFVFSNGGAVDPLDYTDMTPDGYNIEYNYSLSHTHTHTHTHTQTHTQTHTTLLKGEL